MTVDEMWFVFMDGQCVRQFLGHTETLKYIRRKLSGKRQADNKQHRWTYQRGWKGSWTQSNGYRER